MKSELCVIMLFERERFDADCSITIKLRAVRSKKQGEMFLVHGTR